GCLICQRRIGDVTWRAGHQNYIATQLCLINDGLRTRPESCGCGVRNPIIDRNVDDGEVWCENTKDQEWVPGAVYVVPCRGEGPREATIDDCGLFNRRVRR